jgi:hypothetical protein
MKRVIGLVLIAAVVITAGAAVAQQIAPQPGAPPRPPDAHAGWYVPYDERDDG